MKLIVDKNSKNEIIVGLTWGRHEFKPLYKGNDYERAFNVIANYKSRQECKIAEEFKNCINRLNNLTVSNNDWILNYNGYGDIMKVEDFLRDVENGCLTSYDGYGKLLFTSETNLKTRTKKLIEIFPISLYERKVRLSDKPGDYLTLEDAINKLRIEYVVWFNK